jgi:ribosomal protein RSM22 (predicted rRNA methylase)
LCSSAAPIDKEAMNPSFPPALRARTDALLEGVSRRELATRAAAISQGYRAGGCSAATVTDEASVIAYLVARMPATYAAAAAAFDAVNEAAPKFAPKSLLDAGTGAGSTSWAACETWSSLRSVSMMDSNAHFLRMATRLAEQHPILATAAVLPRDLSDTSLPLPSAELITASFVLAEIADPKELVTRLWSATSDTLVLIEPGTPAGFARIGAARSRLIEQGAHVLAPCTHNLRCPIEGKDWCHFSQRLPRSRDHLKVKGASVPFEDERYSYVAVRRAPVERTNFARIVAPPDDSKAGLTLPLCTGRGLHRAFVSRRQRELYALLRKAKWGDTILSEE